MRPVRYALGRQIAVVLLVSLLAGCGGQPSAGGAISLSARQTSELLQNRHSDPNFVILDLRTPEEFNQGHIAGAVLLNYYDPDFKQALGQLEKDKTYLIYCRSGNRSGKTLNLIAGMNFSKVYHLAGGILAWQADNLPMTKPS